MPLAITLAKIAKNTRFWPNVVGLIAGIVGTALGSQLIADQHIFVVHKGEHCPCSHLLAMPELHMHAHTLCTKRSRFAVSAYAQRSH